MVTTRSAVPSARLRLILGLLMFSLCGPAVLTSCGGDDNENDSGTTPAPRTDTGPREVPPADRWAERLIDRAREADTDIDAVTPIEQIGREADRFPDYLREAAVKTLVRRLRQATDSLESEVLTVAALWAIARLGPPHAAAAEAEIVRHITADPQPSVPVISAAARAAFALGRTATINTLCERLGGTDEVKPYQLSGQAQELELALSQGGAEHVPQLIELFSGLATPGVRLSAQRAVWYIGEPATDALVEALTDRDREIRRGAATALAGISQAAIPALGLALSDRDYQVRLAAAKSLGQFGPAAIPTLLDALAESTDPDVRDAATDGLRTAINFARGVQQSLTTVQRRMLDVIVNALDDSSVDVVAGALDVLTEFGPAAEPARDEVMRIYTTGPARLANAAGNVVAALREKARPVIDEVAGTLDSDDRLGRALLVLANLGDVAAAAAPAVAKLLARDDQIGEAAGYTLTRLGDAGAAELIAALKSSSNTRQRNALARLSRLENPSVALLDAVAPHLPEYENLVMEALTAWGAKAAPLVGRFVREKQWIGIGAIGPAADSAIPDLERDLRTTDDAIPLLWAAGRLGPKAAPILVTAWREPGRYQLSLSQRLINVFIGAIGQIGRDSDGPLPQAGELVGLLTETLDQPAMRLGAISALRAFDDAAAPAIDKLLLYLKQPTGPSPMDQQLMQVEVALTLGAIGPKARSAVQPLLEVMRGSRSNQQPGAPVQRAAAEALGRIGRGMPSVRAELINALNSGALPLRLHAAAGLAFLAEAPDMRESIRDALLDSLDTPFIGARDEVLGAIVGVGNEFAAGLLADVIQWPEADQALLMSALNLAGGLGEFHDLLLPAAQARLGDPPPIGQQAAFLVSGMRGAAAQRAE
jgi:HEAT repeat protein